jgi:hypothetical protein
MKSRLGYSVKVKENVFQPQSLVQLLRRCQTEFQILQAMTGFRFPKWKVFPLLPLLSYVSGRNY